RLLRRGGVARELIRVRRDPDALRGHTFGGTGEPIEIETCNDKARFPVALHLDPAALRSERDTVGHRFLDARGRGECGPIAEERDSGVMQRAPMALSAAVGQYPEIEPVAVRMETGRLVAHLDGSDDAASLVRDDARLEEPTVVPRVVLMAHFFDRPGVVGVADVATRHPGRVVIAGERAQQCRRGLHRSRDSTGRYAAANVILVTSSSRARAPAGSRPRAGASPSRSRVGGTA